MVFPRNAGLGRCYLVSTRHLSNIDRNLTGTQQLICIFHTLQYKNHLCRPSLFFKFTVTDRFQNFLQLEFGWGGGGVLQISSDRDDRRIFGGLKFSISGFLGAEKFQQVFFFGSLIVSRCEFANFEWFFCSVNHLSGGGVNASHNAKHSPILACRNKTENDSRLLKNSEGNRDDEWTFCRGQETRIRNDQKNLRRKLVDYCPKQGDHKQRSLKHRNKQSGSKCTNHK